MQAARTSVAEELEAVNALIIDQLESNIGLVENIGHYIVEAGGKRLRPILVLLAGGCCGNIGERHLKLAAAVEFIHTATLLHDDVVDLSTLRRGRPTANAEWGNAPSVLVGDFLYTRAFQLLVSIGNLRLMELMADTTNTIAEGEVLQLTKAGNPDTSESDYLEVIKSKTAVLFAAAMAGGAILSEASDDTVDRLYAYGLNLGNAFQIVDDVLDYEGDPQEMGKNVGDDLSEGKPTLPLIYTAANGTAQQQQLVRTAIAEKSASQLEAIIAAASACGAIDYTRETAAQFSELAQTSIDPLPDSTYKQAAAELCRSALGRRA